MQFISLIWKYHINDLLYVIHVQQSKRVFFSHSINTNLASDSDISKHGNSSCTTKIALKIPEKRFYRYKFIQNPHQFFSKCIFPWGSCLRWV